MLTTRNLSYAFGNSPPIEFPDITCQQGEHWLILGQSGSGKTTLLNLIAGLRSPKTGTVTLGSTEISSLHGAALDQFRGKHIGIIFQQAHFVRSLNLRDNLAVAQKLGGNPVDHTRIEELFEQLNLGHKINAAPQSLSVGEQQRAAIARALVNQPDLILADEPTSALDDHNAEQVIQLLREQANHVNAILLIVTHDNRLTTRFDQRIQL